MSLHALGGYCHPQPVKLVEDTPSDFVFLPAIKDSPVEKIFILLQGAYVPADAYVDLLKEVQQTSPLRLWIAVPKFADNFPEPILLPQYIEEIIQYTQSQGLLTPFHT